MAHERHGGNFSQQLLDRLNREVSEWCPGATVARIEPLPGGQSSLTYRAALAALLATVRASTTWSSKWQYRAWHRSATVTCCAASAAHEVPVREILESLYPRFSLNRTASHREIPPLFAMSLAPGETVEPNTEEEAALVPEPNIVRSRALSAARVLSLLHHTTLTEDLEAVSPPADSSDEITKWRNRLSTVDSTLTVGFESAGDRLLETAPADGLRPSSMAIIA